MAKERDESEAIHVGRRGFLCWGAASAATLAALSPTQVWAAATRLPARSAVRKIALINPFTGEQVRTEYWEKGRYDNDAIHQIVRIMRDHHNNEMHPVDHRLIDLMSLIQHHIGHGEPLQVVCGYRSPETNAEMCERSAGVAANSYHMRGMAIDLRLHKNTQMIYRAASSLRLGGSHYYGHSNFVHVDVGPVRQWA
ncbi:MAG: DUF882 domain-containing protein [Azospirillaceae bacterium]|nr:DUF882 domain-containing protein [Azospirillaceae bacterium]